MKKDYYILGLITFIICFIFMMIAKIFFPFIDFWYIISLSLGCGVGSSVCMYLKEKYL